MPDINKPYNNGEWTQARFNSFVKSALRSASQRWPPKYKVLADSYRITKINEKTGRMAKHYECNRCKGFFPLKDVEVNHIIPVVPISGFDNWDGVIQRLFCEAEGMETLCKPCHKIITKEENDARKSK
mgnify:FL=1